MTDSSPNKRDCVDLEVIEQAARDAMEKDSAWDAFLDRIDGPETILALIHRVRAAESQ